MAIQDEIPKSRLTLRYRTEINGQPQDVQLPLRLLVTGDYSLGSSKDRKLDLDERKMRNMDGRNTDAVMKDMGINLKFSVPNKIDPDKEEDMEVELPIESMKGFSPDQVAQNVPKLKGLLALKRLVQEVNSNIDNRKEFRKLLSDLISNPDALSKMQEELKAFENFKLPKGKAQQE
ncbi:type VI secretion protein, VC_A0107 family [Desulfonatronospira thiodismutans ASO3-1]|uniref:Type VI secretion protein, VC_A0107 family n=1 Tax=Desulfonatronospira thiodismutans ASO3-1 TaxID=555779 RepID=D6SPQ5_9BACT|nr:type VI secretion system contractile sheath small subunit [Desulfonatronospira thiodismutans]EFI34731.1 type VI secretion protein, VC_A0107 family [Desulfonatronospira thiodismutans ASO3-1]